MEGIFQTKNDKGAWNSSTFRTKLTFRRGQKSGEIIDYFFRLKLLDSDDDEENDYQLGTPSMAWNGQPERIYGVTEKIQTIFSPSKDGLKSSTAAKIMKKATKRRAAALAKAKKEEKAKKKGKSPNMQR